MHSGMNKVTYCDTIQDDSAKICCREDSDAVMDPATSGHSQRVTRGALISNTGNILLKQTGLQIQSFA